MLAGYHAVIGARVFEHAQRRALAEADALPVVNLLSDAAPSAAGAGRPAHDAPGARARSPGRTVGYVGRLQQRRPLAGARLRRCSA